MTSDNTRSTRIRPDTSGIHRGRHRRTVTATAHLALVATMLSLASCASLSPTGDSAGGTGVVAGTGADSDLPLGDVAAAGTSGTGAVVAGPITSLANDLDLELCPFAVKNAPPTVGSTVARESALACVGGVELHVAPAPDACMTSGFGPRSGRLHKGIDYQSRPAGAVVAAGAGVIRERKVRPRLGNWIVIDHGNDTFTSYGHLDSIRDEVRTGARVESGQPLGIMGNTGTGITAIHLHYEIRQGDYDRAGYFGLTPIDPFVQPQACVRDA